MANSGDVEKKESGVEPLRNSKREKFCQILTGWGGDGEPCYAYQAYMKAFGIENKASARVGASKIAAEPEVSARIAYMRRQLAEASLIDKAAVRREIYNRRMKIIEKTADTCHKDLALAAMRDVEHSLGLDEPEVSRTAQETVEERSGDAGLGTIRETLRKVITKVEM